jgi:DNA replication and repair protein RecF
VRLTGLTIRNFRNLRSVNLSPAPGVNVIYGENAQGKTNLMEAIYLLTGQKSFRAARESDFVRFGEETARTEADFICQGRQKSAALALGGKKQAWLSGVECTPGELTGEFLAVVFSPGELALIQQGPAERRAFLDGAISQVMPRYLATLAAMGRILLQRNTLIADMLKSGNAAAMEPLLETWDRSLARAAYSVCHARARFLRRLASPAAEIYQSICRREDQPFWLSYQPSIPAPQGADWAEIPPAEGEAHIRAALAAARGEDYKNYCTTLGPHRDNFEVTLAGVSARSFGSQGQQRSCALALKLAQCRVMEETLGEAPIILLDDVLSELDRTRREYFLRGEHPGQVFITCCDRGAARQLCGGAAFRMKEGRLYRPGERAGRKEP